jgi:hypothetical protein
MGPLLQTLQVSVSVPSHLKKYMSGIRKPVIVIGVDVVFFSSSSKLFGYYTKIRDRYQFSANLSLLRVVQFQESVLWPGCLADSMISSPQRPYRLWSPSSLLSK